MLCVQHFVIIRLHPTNISDESIKKKKLQYIQENTYNSQGL